MKVLIVEDDASLSRVLKRSIRRFGYETISAANGEEGLAAFRSERPDLIVSDIDMPRMNGLDMLTEIRKEDDDVIVLIITGYGCESYAIEALRRNANNYLKKPVEFQDLYMILSKYADTLTTQQQRQNLSGNILSRQLTMEIGNDIKLVPAVADRLLQETGERLPSDDRLGVRLGLFEMLMNAIEHGNMGITQQEKSEALREDISNLHALYDKRAASPEVQKRKVRIEFTLDDGYCEWVITDDGRGFDWQAFNQQDPLNSDNLLETNGRGIFLSRLQFDEFQHEGKGNRVRMLKRTT